jgi:hypothetical protein
LAYWIKNQYLTNYYLQETHLAEKNKHRFRVKRWGKIFQANRSLKKIEVAIFTSYILISDEVDFKPKLIRRDKESHFILIKGIIKEEITIVNL